jgi:alpha-tubulin suppressor-like RCC1 family protein
MKIIIKFLSVALVALFVFSCSKDDDNNGGNSNGNTIEGITITTIDITNVKTILATANSKLEVDATKATLTAKGIVWNTSTNPTISLATKTVENSTAGNFQSSIIDLQHSTKYYVRAYATDNKGNTVYGNEISFTTKAGWQTIVSGGNFSVFGIKTDGTLWAWGSNNFGQLGDGSTNQRNSPVQIGADNNWKQISTGGTYDVTPSVHSGYTLAIKNDGSLWAWGNNSDGQLGIGNTSNSYLPTRIGNSNDWKQVKASGYTSSAIKNDGSVWHWGRLKIAFGSSSPLQSNVPVQYAGINHIDFLSVENSGSSYNYLVKKNDGSIWGWGTNSSGQVGNGTISSQINNPTQISNTLNFTSITKTTFISIACCPECSVYLYSKSISTTTRY